MMNNRRVKRFVTVAGAAIIGLASTLSAPIVATAAPSAPAISAPDATAAARGKYITKCQLVRYEGGTTVVGYIYGYGKTRLESVRDANRQVPAGHYKRHCNTNYFVGGSFSIEDDR